MFEICGLKKGMKKEPFGSLWLVVSATRYKVTLFPISPRVNVAENYFFALKVSAKSFVCRRYAVLLTECDITVELLQCKGE